MKHSYFRAPLRRVGGNHSTYGRAYVKLDALCSFGVFHVQTGSSPMCMHPFYILCERERVGEERQREGGGGEREGEGGGVYFTWGFFFFAAGGIAQLNI